MSKSSLTNIGVIALAAICVVSFLLAVLPMSTSHDYGLGTDQKVLFEDLAAISILISIGSAFLGIIISIARIGSTKRNGDNATA